MRALFRELLQFNVHIPESPEQIIFRTQEILVSPE
jgi:hypothetical protein